jgi:hypothetical protein
MKPNATVTILRQALNCNPKSIELATKEDLVALGAALFDLLGYNRAKDNDQYVSVEQLTREYKVGRRRMLTMLASHHVRKISLPAGGLRYHKGDAREFIEANFSAHVSSPDFS